MWFFFFCTNTAAYTWSSCALNTILNGESVSEVKTFLYLSTIVFGHVLMKVVKLLWVCLWGCSFKIWFSSEERVSCVLAWWYSYWPCLWANCSQMLIHVGVLVVGGPETHVGGHVVDFALGSPCIQGWCMFNLQTLQDRVPCCTCLWKFLSL